MAQIKFTEISRASGKVGGTVYASNRGGQYMKRISNQLTKASSFQVGLRSNFSIASGYWRTMTENQKTAWNNAAVLLVKYNKVGNLISRTGFNYFVECHVNLLNYGIPDIMQEVPVPAAIPLSFNYASFELDETFTDLVGTSHVSGFILAGEPLAVGFYATRPFSYGNKHGNKDFHLLGYETGITGQYVVSLDFGVTYKKMFGRFPYTNETAYLKCFILYHKFPILQTSIITQLVIET
jgi:hypothetical protein